MSIRVSSNSYYKNAITSITNQQSALYRVNQQISSNTGLLSPSDDPIATSRVLNLQASKQASQQYLTNQANLSDTLESQANLIGDALSKVQDIQTQLVQANNPILSAADRESLAKNFESRRDALIALANSQDENGAYVFAGYKSSTQPFVRTASGTIYQGDDNIRQIQISPNRSLAGNISGNYAFAQIPTGNGTFKTSASATNNGNGVISSGTVTDLSSIVASDYTITFTSPTSYSVQRLSDSTVVASGSNFVSDQSISFDGMSMSIQGSISSGDTFSVTPSSTASIFTTLDQTIAALRLPDSSVGNTQRSNLLIGLSTDFARAQERLSGLNTTIGSRLNEIQSLTLRDTAKRDLTSKEISSLSDLDLVAASSDLARRQLAVQAAQLSYAQISKLSLFNSL